MIITRIQTKLALVLSVKINQLRPIERKTLNWRVTVTADIIYVKVLIS